MLEIVLLVGLSAAGGEVASAWVAAYESDQRDAALRAFWAARNNRENGVPVGQVQFAPVFVNPTMDWHVPNPPLLGANPYHPFPHFEAIPNSKPPTSTH
jgi:hypothetical protein